MGFFSVIASLFSGNPIKILMESAQTWLESNRRLKEAELETKLKLLQAKTTATISLYQTGLVGDIAWENTAIENAGWKDEFWTLVISTPLILAWFPATQEIVIAGFNTFAGMPDWYQIAVGIAFSTAFGYRKFAEVMALKNGVDISKVSELKKLASLMPTNMKD